MDYNAEFAPWNHWLSRDKYSSQDPDYIARCRHCDDVFEELETFDSCGTLLTFEELENELMMMSKTDEST